MCLRATGFKQKSEEQQYPIWFYPAEHPLEYVQNTNTMIEFRSDGGAYLKLSMVEDPEAVDQWNVEWKIVHGSGAEGTWKSVFPRSMLLVAFGVTSSSSHPPCATELLFRYNADEGALGRFIRRGDCLNIPGPGTGFVGDANLSVLLTDDVKDRIKLFLGYMD